MTESGRTLSHYRLEEEIGRGGMGVVYRALDTRLNRRVAIKVLPPEATGDDERHRRFLREARAAAAVTHPHIASIHEIDEADGLTFIVMELVEGITLQQKIGGRPMPVTEAARLGAEIAEGLARAHAAGIVHRDIKPGNIIIDNDHHAKILDFGLAKIIQEREELSRSLLSQAETQQGLTSAQGRVMGTVAYMSPEQARGEPVDLRSDIFSLGATLYEMVTGRTPFKGNSQLETLTAILRDPAVLASTRNPEIPPRLDEILEKCLEKDPADRYQHTDELLVDLRKLRSLTEPSVSRAVAKPAKTRRRWPLVAGLGLAAAIVVALLIIFPKPEPTGPVTPGGAAKVQSIAVLPLENLSKDPNEEYFADGMTDSLISGLTKIRALRVISRSSVSQYKASPRSLPDIAKALRVETILEGSVLHSGDKVRVNAQLVDVASDRNVWSETYERDERDILGLQSDITRAIVTGIRATLTPQEQTHLETGRTRRVNPEAFRYYLKGRFMFDAFLDQNLRNGLESFRKAIEIDPSWALGYAGLADGYYGISNVLAPPAEVMPKAAVAARRALELDDQLPEAHTSMGIIKAFFEWDWQGAEQDFLTAIRLDPGNALAHRWYANLLYQAGRCDEAEREFAITLDLDPLSRWVAVNAGIGLVCCGQYDRALEQARITLKEHGSDAVVENLFGLVYLGKKDIPEAIIHLEKAHAMEPDNLPIMAYFGHVLGVGGRSREARQLLAKLKTASEKRWLSAYYIALVHLGLGEIDRAFELLDKAYEERAEELSQLGGDPKFDPVRDDPRFQDLLRRVGLGPRGNSTSAPSPVKTSAVEPVRVSGFLEGQRIPP